MSCKWLTLCAAQRLLALEPPPHILLQLLLVCLPPLRLQRRAEQILQRSLVKNMLAKCVLYDCCMIAEHILQRGLVRDMDATCLLYDYHMIAEQLLQRGLVREGLVGTWGVGGDIAGWGGEVHAAIA